MAPDKSQRRAPGDCLSEHNLAQIRDLIVMISIDKLWNHE